MNTDLHLLTLNTQGLREKLKRNRVYEWINHQKADIILLQETHFTKDLEPFVKTEWKGHIIHSFGTSQSRGVSILINYKLNINIDKTVVDKDGRYILLNIKINDTKYCLVNIYAPNDKHKRNSFFQKFNTDSSRE